MTYDYSRFTPLGPKVLVRRDKPVEEIAGIVVPDVAKKPWKERVVTVLSVGTGRVLKDGTVQPLEFKAGDRIMVENGMGANVTIAEEVLLVVDEKHVMGFVEEEDD